MPGHLDVVEGLSFPARYRQGDIARGGDQEPGNNFLISLHDLFAFFARSGWRLSWAGGCGRCTSPLHFCGGRSGVGGRREHLVGVHGPQFCGFRADAVAGQEGGVDFRFLCAPAVGRTVSAVAGREIVAGVSVLCLFGSCWCLR